jgi:hypothetical protein
MSNLISAKDGWLKEENADLYYMLKALDGDAEALVWLENESVGLSCLTRAVAGDKRAASTLKGLDAQELDYLRGSIVNCGQLPWLAERSPELALLFQGVKGDDEAVKRLKRKKAGLARVAQLVRELVCNVSTEPAVTNGQVPLEAGASAEVSLLVAEDHLRQQDYRQAVEAFSRAIDNSPSADAYEGRARAYHALALADERRAAELRAPAR